MAKFVRFPKLNMRYLMLFFVFILSGCASVQMPEYISRVDHPYDKKIYGSFEKVTSAFIFILKNQGWAITSEADPVIYERDDRYDNNGYRNLVIITDIKKSNRLLYSTYMHLNVFIHSIDNTCDVEIRFESQTPLVKRFTSARNDELAENILDAVQLEVEK